ncbi:MAG: hypothetical protein DMG07_27710 [Acidobacteria bacterium]|nr:MAG: hypothetical protein DMG07_27710 [Acidobacteriota bacterium]
MSGCGRRPAEDLSQANDPVVRARKEKDQAFRSGPDSPLPEEERGRFRGLEYFPVSPQYQFRVKLARYERPLELRMATNTSEERRALRYGYFEFQLQGKTCRLQVYKVFEDNESGGSSLFIPFRDATSGRETYGGGRYIDLAENTTGIYDLDLNRAYNPFCAYGRDYSCPLPPSENTLPAAVLAGEKVHRRGF